MSDPTVFFTGFPGFLGSALLERVLARGDGPVACLVQPDYLETARRRKREIVAKVGSGDDEPVRLYEGDITEPDLGLGVEWEQLDSIREIYHLAAVYDLGVDPDLAEAVNVRGTEHLLEFAANVDVDAFHYVSTCYVSGRYDGVFTEDKLREGQSFNNHYEASKYRAEVAVQDRMADGFPATVYRPAIVVGDSRTGETDKFDGPYNMLRLLLAQPSWLSVAFTLPGSRNAELNVVPRDFVVDAIAYLSDTEESVGEVFQLCDPTPLTVPQFIDGLADAIGHRTVSIPTTKGLAKALVPLVDRTPVDLDPNTMEYLDHRTRYACPNTRRGLAESAIEVPPFETYVGQLVEFARLNPDIGSDPMV